MTTILIVDDESLVLTSLQMMLMPLEAEVVTVDSGSEALGYLKTNARNVNLIILDLMMPDMPGLEVFQKIKSNASWGHIAVVLHTGIPDGEEAQKAFSMGAAAILPKVANTKEKLTILRNVINGHKS